MIGPRVVILLVLVGTASPSAARSQAIITLDGLVRGEGGGIGDAHVVAVDSLTNERRSAMTNERGFFRILDLSPGDYAVSVRAIGYAPATQTIHVVVGERAQIEIVLDRSPVTLETVNVREQRAPATEITRLSVSTAVTDHEIQHLPLLSRNVMELAAVAPGIRALRPVAGRSLPSAGALRDERGINLYLDGVELKNMTTGNLVGSPQSGSPLPADGLQEFRVFLNPYDAEYTRGAAYVISAVTHRGTNQRHGSAFGFFQNASLVSVTAFQRRIPNYQRPDFSRGMAGFTLRGPVVRDRLFYAASYELSRTEDFIAVIPGRPASNPAVWDQYAGIFKAPNRNHTGVLRLTYSPNEGNEFDAIGSSRYMTGESGFGGSEAHESGVRQRYVVNTAKLRHRWLPSSQLASELSLQLVDWSHADRPLVAGPVLRYPTLGIGRGNSHNEVDETRVHVTERVTYSAGSGPGSHLLKGGVEVARVTAKQFAPTNGRVCSTSGARAQRPMRRASRSVPSIGSPMSMPRRRSPAGSQADT